MQCEMINAELASAQNLSNLMNCHFGFDLDDIQLLMKNSESLH